MAVDVAVLDALLDAGGDVNWVGWDDLTPLDAAQRSEADDVVGWLRGLWARSAADLG